MKLTADQLVACGIAPTQANAFLDPIAAACTQFDIATPQRLAAFLGQCVVESGNLVHTEENLFYSDPARIFLVFPSHFSSAVAAAAYAKNPRKLGARVYANRLGNGDEASGDGYTYRGRGLIQLTGRANYARAAQALVRGYISDPDLVAQPGDACLSAAWYWSTIDGNALADAGATDAITKAVNGPRMLEAALRRQRTSEALQVLSS